jgi:hypothetical protein
MGQIKSTYTRITQDLTEMGGIPVYVLTCNGKPCNVYIDKTTADYEMWLCKQAEAHMEDKVKYKLTEVMLSAENYDSTFA